MEAHRSLAKLLRVHHAMHRIRRINRTGMRRIHFDCVSGRKLRPAAIDILRDEVKVLDHQPANGHRHPAILIAMIVH